MDEVERSLAAVQLFFFALGFAVMLVLVLFLIFSLKFIYFKIRLSNARRKKRDCARKIMSIYWEEGCFLEEGGLSIRRFYDHSAVYFVENAEKFLFDPKFFSRLMGFASWDRVDCARIQAAIQKECDGVSSPKLSEKARESLRDLWLSLSYIAAEEKEYLDSMPQW